MNKEEFLENFANQFDETDSSDISLDTKFHDLDEWSSLIGMSVIAMAKVSYNKMISGAEVKACMTVEDLFNLIEAK